MVVLGGVVQGLAVAAVALLGGLTPAIGVLAVAGFGGALLMVSGRSLLGCLEGCDDTRPIFAELIPDGPFPNNVRKVRRGDRTVIWDVRRNTFQAFDLAEDPEELANVIESAESEELRDLLRAWVAHSSRGENRGQQITYHNVVRNVLKVGDWNGKAGSWTVPLENISRDGLDAAAVYIQDGNRDKPGPMLGAAFTSLN